MRLEIEMEVISNAEANNVLLAVEELMGETYWANLDGAPIEASLEELV
jgi:hypothetical protein